MLFFLNLITIHLAHTQKPLSFVIHNYIFDGVNKYNTKQCCCTTFNNKHYVQVPEKDNIDNAMSIKKTLVVDV